ncbi:MAG: hypothetical protein KGL39_41045 [Patescibacteria group bacterium]|nr:hypothetical protein [Patescibacteria group bacterium]
MTDMAVVVGLIEFAAWLGFSAIFFVIKRLARDAAKRAAVADGSSSEYAAWRCVRLVALAMLILCGIFALENVVFPFLVSFVSAFSAAVAGS